MACVLCFEDGTKTRERLIDIFSEEGSKLNICSLIAKHLWFKPQNDFSHTQCICWNCWVALRDFNAFYLHVAELHLTDWKYPSTCVESEQDKDPLPQEMELKYEEFRDEGEKQQVSGSFDVNFDAEIKIEVHDFDDLPRVEIFEESSQGLSRSLHSPKTSGDVSCVNNNNKESRHAETKKRRGRPRKNESNTDASQAKRKRMDDIEDIDVALLETAKHNVENVENIENSNKKDTDANPDSNPYRNDNKTITSETQKKRRGRPRKVKKDEPISLSPVVEERNEEGNVQDGNSTKSEIKLELPLIEGISDDNDNNVDADSTAFHATEDSESSSTDSDDSEKSNPAQYAVIPKKKVVKPKKYRKRSKEKQVNTIPRKRLTREELDAKKAQQEEYERVIKKFFGRITCSVCELFVHNFTEMREHQRFSHNIDPAYIMCCGRKFVQRKLMAEHIYLHWNPEHFKCRTCGEICSSSRQLTEHERGHVDPTKMKGLKNFQCDRCENAYTTKGALQQHFHSKHIPKSEFKVACPECDKKFATKNSFHDHKKKCHDPKIVCDKCGKQVRTTYLKKHNMLEHSEVPRPAPEPQQCQVCGTWLRHMSGLRQHMKAIHEDPGGEHRCQICNKVSTTARALRRHIYLNHECERKFKCTMCEKAFKRPQDLREHTSVHTGKVLYNCPNCSMTFFSSANMYKHRQRLHRAEYEADRKKPKHLFNIMEESRSRLNGLFNEVQSDSATPCEPIS